MLDHIKQHQEQINKSISNSIGGSASSQEDLEKSVTDYFEKAKVVAPVGTIKKMGGRNYIKTNDGWKYHGSGGGAVAQQNAHAARRQASAEQVAASTGIPESQAEAPKVDINQRFQAFARYTKTIINGGFKSLIAYGTGGVGKTFTVTHQLDAAGKVAFDEDLHRPANAGSGGEGDEESEDEGGDEEVKSTDYDYVKLTGKMTAPQLYKALFEHNDKILLFDDIDSVLRDQNAVNLFKGALDTSGDGTISYNTSTGVKGEDGEKLPNRFKFTGQCIFISNMAADEVPQPVKSRSLRVDLTMSPEQTMERIKFISKNKEGKYQNLKFPGIKYSHNDLKDVIDYLDKNKYNTSDLNVRTIGALLSIKQMAETEGVDWKEDADHMIFSKSEESKAFNDNPYVDINKSHRERINGQFRKARVMKTANCIEKSDLVKSDNYVE